MKNLLTLLAIILGVGVANAQTKKQPTLEETVNYLNTILEGTEVSVIPYNEVNTRFIFHTIKVTPNGNVAFFHKEYKYPIKFNVFDISIFENSENKVSLKANEKVYYDIRLESNKEKLDQVEKAFKHLQTVCVNDKNLF